ncbi:MAG: type I 3-dehydroquinate dehydratase [Thaumarchaeota archaeon]|nr:type I 3-dehydroquinate dehydratase [Nitrososphaerota archaeon]
MKSRLILCTSLTASSCVGMAKKAALALTLGSDLVEFRIDRLHESSASQIIKHLSPFFDRAVVTVRPVSEGGAFMGSERRRIELIKELVSRSPTFIDLELRTIESNEGLIDSLKGLRKIVSWHSTSGTPSLSKLRERAAGARKHGGLVKIVTTARKLQDCCRVSSLYGPENYQGLVAFCLGEFSLISRIFALQLGCPLMYCSLPGEPLARGQVSIEVMKQLRELVERD